MYRSTEMMKKVRYIIAKTVFLASKKNNSRITMDS